ncbi:helix-turn-helix transcriptional regulator [Antrihabitans sp. YC2-6]|uniref:helix-turn-helix transcriptional regulator n=1 Tax=Antrihabitans sp. YC2-6 TaxID=2799498 RepID=UPI0018F3B5EC|nr:helix-turn-helix transcriptional regulator [Antrihabitans sp. YC2-6]MBJ8345812.1 LuxR family transcriptional regulator [Antrihabitans sp. YC2-6]
MLIGRERARAELERLLGASSAVFVIIEGESGSGKTAVLEEFLTAHPGTAGAVAAQWESERPYGVLEQLTKRTPHGPAHAVAREFEAPRSIVVDDAQWTDLESLQVLFSVVRIGESPTLVVAAYSAETPMPTAVRDLLDGATTRIRLAPYGVAEVQKLARSVSGVELSAPTARALVDHTDGNPRDLACIFAETPRSAWDHWQSTLPVPKAVAAGVAAQLLECSAAARAVLEAAAVLGDDAPVAQVADLADLADLADPIDVLDELRDVVALGETRGLGVVRFRKPLVRAAIQNSLGPRRARELHLRAAEIAADEGAELRHLAAAEPVSDEVLADRFERHAAELAGVGAWAAVADSLIRASRVSVDAARRERRLIRAVDALVGAGRLPEAKEYAAELESLPRSAMRDAVLGYLAIQLGRTAEATALLDEAWRHCDPTADPETAALICQRKVLDALGRWHGPDLVDWTNRAVELAEPGSPAAVESAAILGLGLGASGRTVEARAAYTELGAARGAQTRGAQTQRFQMGKGWLDLALDDPDAARHELESAVPTVFRKGSARISLWAGAWLARTQFALGAWDEAYASVERSARTLDDVELDLLRPLVHWTGAQIAALRGDWPTADRHLSRCSAGSRDYQMMFIPAALATAQCAEVKADYAAVVRALEPLTRVEPRAGIDEPGFWPWPDVYANALVMSGRVDAADGFLAAHEARAEQRGHRSASARLGYVRGRILGARNDIAGARAVFERSLESIAALPLPYDRARINFAYGQTLRRAGKRREADTVLNAARDGYVTLGASSYVERCDRELRAGGIDRKRNEDPFGDLTPQEQAVAGLVARGASNKEAAEELFLSVKTVQYHLTRVYAKLGVRSRSELALSLSDTD